MTEITSLAKEAKLPTLSELQTRPNLAESFQNGKDAYARGVSYQWCSEIRGSLEEYAWQRGWDSSHIGDIPSIASFDGTHTKEVYDD